MRVLGLRGVDDPDDEEDEGEGEEGLPAEEKEGDTDHLGEKENLSPGLQVVEDGDLKRRVSPRSS